MKHFPAAHQITNQAHRSPEDVLRKRVRAWLIVFIVGLVVSGLTAFPLVWEVNILTRCVGDGTATAAFFPALSHWMERVNDALMQTDRQAPFLFYGTDWLAFAHLMIAVAHLMIAVAFWGPLRDPVRNIWVLEFGLIACVCVIPTVLVCGFLRGIPPFWQLIDCAFGVFGFVPLWLARRDILRLETLTSP